MFRIADRRPARGTCVWEAGVWERGGRGAVRGELEGEPFFKAGATEGVQAVEEGKGLVEDFSADLYQRSILAQE